MEISSGGVTHQRPIGDKMLRFTATDIRKEHTGVHAKVRIILQRTVLATDTFNISRHTDRVRLGNAAHKHLGSDLGGILPKEHLEHELMIFCEAVWETWIESQRPVMVDGDPVGEPISFWAKPHIIKGGGTILFGPRGRGKSYTAMLMAVTIDAGSNHFWESTQGPALYINLERDARSMKRRLGLVNTALGLDPARQLLMLNARGKSLMDVQDMVQGAIDDGGVELIILDSISRAGFGDLNENRPANATIDCLNGFDRSWLAIAHSPRSDESHVFGSVHYEAGADIVIQLMSEAADTELGIGLQIIKANDIGRQPIKVLRYEFDEWGLSGVNSASMADYPSFRAGAGMSMADQIQDYLLNEAGKATATDIAQELGKDRSSVSRLLRADQRFVGNRDGNKVLYSVRAEVSS
jgi:hypothetical protein